MAAENIAMSAISGDTCGCFNEAAAHGRGKHDRFDVVDERRLVLQ